MANPLNKLVRSAERAGDETLDVIRMFLRLGQNPADEVTADVAAGLPSAAAQIPVPPPTGAGSFGRGPAMPAPVVATPQTPATQGIGGLGWSGSAQAAGDVAESLPAVVAPPSAPAPAGYLESLLARLGIGGQAAPKRPAVFRLPDQSPSVADASGTLGSDYVRQAQAAAEEASNADMARQLEAIAQDASGGVVPVNPRSVQLNRPVLNNAEIAEQVDADKARELAFMSGRFDGLQNQTGPMTDLRRSVIADRVVEANRARQILQGQMQMREQIGNALDAARGVAAKWGGPAGVAAGVGAGAAALNNLSKDMSRASGATTADLAAAVPAIAAVPDEQPSYMASNPGAEVTPEQRAKAAADYEALQQLNHNANMLYGTAVPASEGDARVQTAASKVLAPIKAQSRAEDNRLAAMASDQDLAHMEEVQRQQESNLRMQAMADGLPKPQAQQKKSDAVLPSDNLAAVEQQITPEPVVKSKPKPIATASAYDDPTGSRFNMLIANLAQKAGISVEEARAMYKEGVAKDLSPRQAMQPVIDLGAQARNSDEAKRRGNVSRAAMTSLRNPRRESNLFGMQDPADQAYSLAVRASGDKAGPSPREMAAQKQRADADYEKAKMEKEVLAEQARLERESQERQKTIMANGQVSAAYPSALATLAGQGMGAFIDWLKVNAMTENAKADRKQAEELYNTPKPETATDAAVRQETKVKGEAAATTTKLAEYQRRDAVIGIPGAAEALATGKFRVQPARDALQKLAADARKAGGQWFGVNDKAIESMNQSLEMMGVTDPALRSQLVQEYLGGGAQPAMPGRPDLPDNWQRDM